MDYQEVNFEDIKDVAEHKNGWRPLGDYGWGFSDDSVDLIKKISKEDGWRIVKVVDADEHRTGGHKRDYYLISDKYKVFVAVDEYFWNNGSFQDYLEKKMGTRQKYLVKLELENKETGHKSKRVFGCYAHNEKEAEEKALEDFARFYPSNMWSFRVIDSDLDHEEVARKWREEYKRGH